MLLILLGLLAAAPAQASNTTYPGATGELLFYTTKFDGTVTKPQLVSTSGQIRSLPNATGGAVFESAVSGDGRLIAYRQLSPSNGEQLAVTTVDGSGPAILATTTSSTSSLPGRPVIPSGILSMSFSPNGNELAVSSFTGDLVIVPVDVLRRTAPAPAAVRTLNTGTSDPVGVFWDPDDGNLIVTKGEAAVRMDPRTGATVGSVSTPPYAVGADGTRFTRSFRGSLGTGPRTLETDISSSKDGVIFDDPGVTLPEGCRASATCPRHEFIQGAYPAPDGRLAVVVTRLDTFGTSHDRIELREPGHPAVVLVPDADPLDSKTQSTTMFVQGWVSKPPPLIFVHGFLGSRITCHGGEGDAEKWPALPFPPFGDIALAADGIGGTGDCADAGPSGLVLDPFSIDIYKSTQAWLTDMAGDNGYAYTWDWRRSPAQAVAGLEAKIDEALGATGAEKAVVFAHSAGGLVTRLYAADPARRAKLARVLTMGTPYWGSVKSTFPLISGEEFIGGGEMDPVLTASTLQHFARNLSGLYALWPSASFGPFLAQGGQQLGAADMAGNIGALGGSTAAYDLGRAIHPGTDSLAGLGDLPWEVIRSTGVPTPKSLTFGPSGSADLEVGVAFGDGDGTVPARSASLGDTDDRPVHEVCGVGHVKLPNDLGVEERARRFLVQGEPLKDADDRSCPVSGVHVQIHEVDVVTRAAPRRAGPPTVDEAERTGQVDAFRLGRTRHVVIPGTGALALTIDAPGAQVDVSSFAADGSEGPVSSLGTVGPTGGQLTVGGGTTPALTGTAPAPGPTTPAGGGDNGGAVPTAGGGAAPTVRPTAARDTTRPRTTIKVKRLRGGRVRVTLTAKDAGGVKRIRYRIGRAAAKTYQRPFTVTRAQLKRLTAFAEDRAGNVEAPRKAPRA